MRLTPNIVGLTLGLAVGAALAQDQPTDPQPLAPRQVLLKISTRRSRAGTGRSWCSPYSDWTAARPRTAAGAVDAESSWGS